MRERMLFLSAQDHNHHPEDFEGWIRTRSILEILLEKYDVDLLVYGNFNAKDIPDAGNALTVHIVKPAPAPRRAMLGALYKQGSRSYPGNGTKDIKNAITGLCRLNRYHHVFISHNLAGNCLDMVRQALPEATLITDAFRPGNGISAGKAWRKRGIGKPYQQFNAALVHRNERKLMKKTGLLLTASEWDALSFKSLSFEDAGKVHVVPHIIDLSQYEAAEPVLKENRVVLHWNMNTVPGKNAAILFYQKIVPLIQAKVSDIEFYLISREVRPKLVELVKEDPAVAIVTGPVENAAEYIRKAKVVVAPLFEGIGARLEILESWALRTPVVTTFRGSEALMCEHNRNILIGKSTEEMADHIMTLLNDPMLSTLMTDRAYQTLLKHYETSGIKEKVLDLV